MRLRQVQIERFRGIKSLDWSVSGGFVCLIGPGDSTKTTILDAIELALSPRWNVTFDDADFYEAKTDEPISITVTVGDLPDELKSDAKYGLLARGWSPAGECHDEPEDGDQLILSIRLQVGASLEPSWTVINDPESEGIPISAKDRESLGCTRLCDFLDRHFAWGRGSILSRLTEKGDSLPGMLAEANRAARAKLADLGQEALPKLRSAQEQLSAPGVVASVKQWLRKHRRQGRLALAKHLCKKLDLRDPLGKPRIAGVQKSLRVLEARGLWRLPKQRVYPRGYEARRLGSAVGPCQGVPSRVEQVRGLRLAEVSRSDDELFRTWNELMLANIPCTTAGS